MEELERARKLYGTQYRVDYYNRDYIWHPRNPISLVHAQILDMMIIRIFNRLNIELVDRKILDVGCGYGRRLRFWAEMGASPHLLYGYDLMNYRLQRARELSPNINFSLGDASKMPYPPESFDIVSQFSVFSSIHDEDMRQNAAAEIKRILKPSGWLVWYDLSTGKGGNTRALKKKEVFALFSDLQIAYVAPIFARELGRIIRISPDLTMLWDRLPFIPKIGLVMIFRHPG
jgi:ubiquinone/menaquinone biosynthesis C-methylase UbiE